MTGQPIDADDMQEMMDNETWEKTFDPMIDISERWGITMTEAEMFLESVDYFESFEGEVGE